MIKLKSSATDFLLEQRKFILKQALFKRVGWVVIRGNSIDTLEVSGVCFVAVYAG
jgi:hypothetical protein